MPRFHHVFESRTNQTSIIELVVDTFIERGADIERIYRPRLLSLIEAILVQMKEKTK